MWIFDLDLFVLGEDFSGALYVIEIVLSFHVELQLSGQGAHMHKGRVQYLSDSVICHFMGGFPDGTVDDHVLVDE
jgi:hypothetical protein